MQYDSIMLDMETLGTHPGSVILSIGAVRFDTRTLQVDADAPFLTGVDLQDSLARGRLIDADTLSWWLAQAPGALRGLISPQPCRSLEAALTAFSAWVKEPLGVAPASLKVWGHGAGFDPVLLEDAYRSCERIVPFSYWNVRDTRTVFDLADFGYKAYAKANNEKPHDALSDALTQANAVCLCLKKLRGPDGG